MGGWGVLVDGFGGRGGVVFFSCACWVVIFAVVVAGGCVWWESGADLGLRGIVLRVSSISWALVGVLALFSTG